jgi:DNA-binding response OmpR family regulator
MRTHKILIVEDDESIARAVSLYLQDADFDTITVSSGREALKAFQDAKPTLVLMDLLLPEMNGMDVTRVIRRESGVPIVMLTSRSDEADRVAGLEIGADDYVVKPFSLRELLARIRAVLRRAEGGLALPLEVGDVRIDFDRRAITLKGMPVELTSTEFDLLALLAQNPGKVFTRLQLIEQVRGSTYECFDRTVDVHIRNVRKKIEQDPSEPRYILTVQRVGYKFCAI